MIRKVILEKAINAVCEERKNQYGELEDNFEVIASLWQGYIGIDFSTKDVAAMMILLKIARISTGTAKADYDSWIDIAGYAACGAECESNILNIVKE